MAGPGQVSIKTFMTFGGSWAAIARSLVGGSGVVVGHVLGVEVDLIENGARAAVVGALVNYRRHAWTFVTPPLQVYESHYAEALVSLILREDRRSGRSLR